MNIKKILWLEDQHEDLNAFKGAIYRSGYFVKTVKSVSEAEKEIRNDVYHAYIFDIKVLAGDDEKWIELDRKKRKENPDYDSYLGLELLTSLFSPNNAAIKLDPPIEIDSKRVIVFSVVHDKNDNFESLGIPIEHIISKAVADLETLPELIRQINNC